MEKYFASDIERVRRDLQTVARAGSRDGSVAILSSRARMDDARAKLLELSNTSPVVRAYENRHPVHRRQRSGRRSAFHVPPASKAPLPFLILPRAPHSKDPSEGPGHDTCSSAYSCHLLKVLRTRWRMATQQRSSCRHHERR